MASARSHCPDGGRRTSVAAPVRLDCPAAGALVCNVSSSVACTRVVFLAFAAALGLATTDESRNKAHYRIENPTVVPASMQQEGGGPHSPFFPSSANTNVGGIIPANFFMTSESCGRCHKDIYEQWNVVGAPLLVVQQPVVPQVDRVHAGRRRHAAVEVVRRLPRSRGVLQRPLRPADQGADRHAGGAGRPRLHVVPLDHARRQHDGPGRLRRSSTRRCTISRRASNPVLQLRARPAASYLDPEPHRETFLKPFHREQTAGVLLVAATRSTSTCR